MVGGHSVAVFDYGLNSIVANQNLFLSVVYVLQYTIYHVNNISINI